MLQKIVRAWFDATGRFDPPARDFYERMRAEGYDPAAHIDVVPQLRILYIAVPKAATSTVKSLLGSLMGRDVKTPRQAHKRRLSGLPGPAQMSRRTFFDIATGADSFRFTFVRNPYDRLVSCWLDKYQDKPLHGGDSFARLYLAARPTRAETLSFPDFVSWAAETAAARVNAHWALQDDLVSMPGIALDHIGKVENFDADILPLLARTGLPAPRHNLNVSGAANRRALYTPPLAALVERAYARDFERFGYSREV